MSRTLSPTAPIWSGVRLAKVGMLEGFGASMTAISTLPRVHAIVACAALAPPRPLCYMLADFGRFQEHFIFVDSGNVRRIVPPATFAVSLDEVDLLRGVLYAVVGF